jgi:long-chain acyl-CoA synthetase
LNFPIYLIAKLLIFKKIKGIWGSDIKYFVGGGALLDVYQQEFFYSIGVPVFQGYGLTEAAPIISANTPYIHKLGTSGKVLPSVDCRIIDDEGNELPKGEKGQIIVKGDNVMKGYYNNPEETAKTIKDDWLYTGDLGYFDNDNFLVVTGREKALLISEDGEKYSPEEIEEAIVSNSEFIAQVMLYNDHKKITSSLITLNKERLNKHLKTYNIKGEKEVVSEISKSMKNFKNNKNYKGKFPEKWLPSTFRIIEEPFSEQNKMINSTMKMVRYKIVENYSNDIELMHSKDGNKIVYERNIDSIKSIL